MFKQGKSLKNYSLLPLNLPTFFKCLYCHSPSSNPSLEGFIISLHHHRHRVITTKGSQARPGAFTQSTEFTFGIQDLKIYKSQNLKFYKSQNL